MGSQYLSAYPSMERDTPEARARSATMAYDSSRGTYEEEVSRARGARDQAQGQADRTRVGADRAAADYASGGGATPLTAWKPTAMTAYAPTQMAQWMASARGGGALPARSPGGGGSRSSMRMSTDPADSFESKNLEGFDASALENFDPSSFGKEFAGGAYGDFKRRLGDELETLTNESVARGRFDTGLFDEDRGRVVTRLGEDFNDSVAQQSGVFSGQRLDALKGGADLRFRRASEMDTNARSVYEQRQELARREAEQASADSIARERLDLEGFGLETDRYRIGGEFAQSRDELDYRRAHDMDTMTYDQARELTGIGEGRARTGLETSLSRERMYNDDAFRRSGAASDAASGQRDWAARDRELEELRAEIEEMRRTQSGLGPNGERYGGSPGRTSSNNPYAGTSLASYWKG